MLDGYHPGGTVLENDKKSLAETLSSFSSTQHVDYVFIGGSLNLDDAETDTLLRFVMDGHDAFIASLEAPDFLLDKIYPYECGYKVTYLSENLESVKLNFYHDALRSKRDYEYSYRVVDADVGYAWRYIAKGIFCDSTRTIVPLGYRRENLVNFLKIPYGSGNIYLHCNPIVFTNYFMTKPDKVEYAASVFSHLRGRDIIWDERSKLPYIGNNSAYNSPLYYILQQPNLKYAWWLMIITVLLYVLFAIKRTQRVIPVIEPKTNTSLQFIHQIAVLHFQNGDHLDMARKKMKYFLYFIRAKYGMQQTTSFGEGQILKLAGKAKVHEGDVRTIFNQYEIIERNSNYAIPSYRLVDLYYAIDNFYKNCK